MSKSDNINHKCKYIIVTGGVLSSLGKGIASASIGALMESRGLSVSLMKFDPYLNVDPGFMSPYQHGEIFITDDGSECDLDIGHYERYNNIRLSTKHNIAAGRIYYNIIQKERSGSYGDVTVQIIPHLTDEIKNMIREASDGKDISIVEIGGTVGDIESLPFLEAARQLRLEEGQKNVLFVHLTLVPFIKASDEVKTKPTQHSVATLRGIGIQPDILICRTDQMFDESVKKKLSLFCNVPQSNVICSPDVEHVYEIPLTFNKQKLDDCIVETLGMWTRQPELSLWEDIMFRLNNPLKEIRVGILDEGVGFKEAYKSLTEALIHSGILHQVKITPVYLDALKGVSAFEKEDLQGLLIPNGQVLTGKNGKISIIKAAREKKLPVLGMGTGLHLMLIEAAKNLAHLKNADSTEFNPETSEPVVHLFSRWFNPRTGHEESRPEGANWAQRQRKGLYPAELTPNSLLSDIYGEKEIAERHRHRGEFNMNYKEILEKHKFVISALSPDGKIAEAFELIDHSSFYVGVQFQPEFLSRPMAPHPLISAFIGACLADSITNGEAND